MSGFQSPITIAEAMSRINSSEYLLPAFQRDFVWKNGQIEKLFDSLMCGYPTSSMLFWKVKGETKTKWKFYRFIDKFILNAKDYSIQNDLHNTFGANDFHAILDGQQRLTALRIGIYGKYAYHEQRKSWNYSDTSFPWRQLYLCISKTNSDDEDCKYIFHFQKDADTNGDTFYTDTNDNLWFKVNGVVPLFHSGEEISDFYHTVTLTKDQRILINRLKKVIFTDFTINFYEEDEQNPDKAVKIFTRINSGGTFLSFSDIVFSLMVAHWERRDARSEIRDLISRIAQKGFEIDKDYIVKVFLYLYHHRIKTEIRSFDKVFCSKIEQNWDKIKESIISLFDLLRSFGLTSFSLTSNNATLPILYYLYHKNIYINYANKTIYESDRKNIKQWLFSVILRKLFGGQSDSILQQSRKSFTDDINKSFIDVTKDFNGKSLNDCISTAFQLEDEFIDELIATQKDDRYAFPILSLLYPNLDYKNNNFHKDHLHPESAYNNLSDSVKDKYPFSAYNSILNLQMLDSNQNQSKNDMALSDWVDKECNAHSYQRSKFLADHLIPNVDLSLSNFEEYAEERKKMLRTQLKKIML